MYVLKILTTHPNSIGLVYSDRVALGDIQQTQYLVVSFTPGVVSGRFECDFDPDACTDTRRIGPGSGNEVTAKRSDRNQLDVHGLHSA